MENHSAAVKIVSWFLAIVSVGAVATCLLVSRHVLRKKWLSFALLFGALASNIGTCIAISAAASHGLGKLQPDCSKDELATMQKAFYSMQILQTITVGLGKLSLVALFALLLSPSNLERIALAISTALALWTLSTAISVAAQCSTPNVWNLASGSCINVTALWRYWGATNILIEVMMFATVVFVITRLHMRFWSRAIVIGCFSARIADIAVTAIQLNYTEAFDTRGCNFQLQVWPWALCGQVLQTVTIVSASVPHIRDFLESVPSGMLRLHEIDSTTGQKYGSRTTLKGSTRSDN